MKAWRIYRRKLSSSARINAMIRSREARISLSVPRKAAILIQSLARGRISRRELLDRREAGIYILKRLRGMMVRKRYRRVREAILTLQAFKRGLWSRREWPKLNASALMIQGAWRAHSARDTMKKRRRAHEILIRWVRRAVDFVRTRKHRRAVSMMSHYIAGNYVRSQYRKRLRAVDVMQRAWRVACAKRSLRLEHAAAVTLQRAVLSYLGRRYYVKSRALIVYCQGLTRRKLAYIWLRKRHEAATVIQSLYLRHFHRLRELKRVERGQIAAVVLNAHVRSCLIRMRNKRDLTLTLTLTLM